MKLKGLIAVIALIFMGSCIYEDGPKLSLRSKTNRAVNVWYIDKVYEDGTDKTDAYKSAYVNYRLELNKDDSYELSCRPFNVGTYNEKGTWKFNGAKTEFIFTPSGTTQENRYKILRLKNSELWVSHVDNGKTIEIRLRD